MTQNPKNTSKNQNFLLHNFDQGGSQIRLIDYQTIRLDILSSRELSWEAAGTDVDSALAFHTVEDVSNSHLHVHNPLKTTTPDFWGYFLDFRLNIKVFGQNNLIFELLQQK